MKWMVAAKKADFEAWALACNISPITARLIRNRGIVSVEEARGFLEDGSSHDPALLCDISRAAGLLIEARAQATKIRVIGDYDADGICSSYILKTGLSFAGMSADVRLPERVREGYGLNKSLIDEAISDGIELILTCDNGVGASDEIAYARAQGLRVIVTDHHEVPRDEAGGDLLPEADAVVDPKRADCPYPFEGICGAVVAYKLLEVLFVKDIADGTASYTEAEVKVLLKELNVFAAIATVCDVMLLADENRGIVRRGLRDVKTSKNPGLRALINVTGLEEKEISAYHVGFVLGPCLNASGRLDTAERALSLLEASTEEEAVRIATDIKHLNDSRKEMTQLASERAEELILKEELATGLPKILVTYLPDCHESIAGIVAGRVREHFHRPAIIFTDALSEDPDEALLKGSGRSIEAYDMFLGLSGCADLFTKFGGHKAAAGMTLPKRNLEMLKNRLNARASLTEEDLQEVLHIDIVLPFAVLTTELIREWDLLAPFGNGNPVPLFATRNVKLLNGRRIGRDAQYGRFTVRDEAGTKRELLCFQDPSALFTHLEEMPERPIHLAYEAQINLFRGEESVQFVFRDFLPAD